MIGEILAFVDDNGIVFFQPGLGEIINNVFDQLGDFLVVGVTGEDIGVVLGWVLVLVAGYSLPIAFVFGLLLALGRFDGDGEIAAMRASGLNVFALVRPVLAVGVLLSLASGTVSIGLEHMAWKEIEATKRRLLSRGAAIEPGRFQRFGCPIRDRESWPTRCRSRSCSTGGLRPAGLRNPSGHRNRGIGGDHRRKRGHDRRG